jgi:hypothetical protein
VTTVIADTLTPTLERERRPIHGGPEGALQSGTPLATERPSVGGTDPVLPTLQFVLAGKFTAQIFEGHAVAGRITHIGAHHPASVGEEADSVTVWKER